jgi:hypothetical protein
MRVALSARLGEDPAAPVLALALGKTALETGRWQSMWNSNWGNIKCSDKYEGFYTCIVLNEVIPGRGVVWFDPLGELTGNPAKGGRLANLLSDANRTVPPGHPQTRMRAYQTPSEGALDYCRFVAGGRYAGAWSLLLDGDAAGYVHALKQAGYFTADEETYKRGVVSLQKEFVVKLSGLPHNEPSVEVPPADEVRSWLTPVDVATLEAQLSDRYFDLLEMNRKDALREMSESDDDEVTKVEGSAGRA